MNQNVREIEKEEHKKLAEHYTQEVRKSCTLESENIELNRKMKKTRDSLEEKEESNNQLLTELTAQKEVEGLLKLDHPRNQETHHEEMTVKLIKSVTDKIVRSNQEELEAERISQNNIMKQFLDGVDQTAKLAKYKKKYNNLKEQIKKLKNHQI